VPAHQEEGKDADRPKGPKGAREPAVQKRPPRPPRNLGKSKHKRKGGGSCSGAGNELVQKKPPVPHQERSKLAIR